MPSIKLENISIRSDNLDPERLLKIFPAKDASGRNYHPDFIRYMQNKDTISEKRLEWTYVDLIIEGTVYEDALIAVMIRVNKIVF